MRIQDRMRYNAILLIVSIGLSLCCGQGNATNSIKSDLASVVPTATTQPTTDQITVQTVGFFAYRQDGEREKTQPYRIDEWKESKRFDRHQTEIEIKYELRNDSASNSDATIQVKGAWIIAPRGQYGAKSVGDIINEVSWTDETILDQLTAKDLEARKSREFKVRGFELRKAIKELSDLALWTWKFRVNIYVHDASGKQISEGSAILTILPSDFR